MSGRSRRGLTLWEVLAAASGMVLIAFVGACLLPFRSREIGHRRSCIANTRMLSMATSMYLQDYDGRLPPSGYMDDGQFHALPAILNPYIKNGNVWCCPDDLFRGDESHRFDNDPGDTTVSYGYNWLSLAPNGRGVRVDQAQSPDQTVLFAETTSYRVIPARLASTRPGTIPVYVHPHGCTVAWLSGRTSYSPSMELEHTSISEGSRMLEAEIEAFRFWDLK